MFLNSFTISASNTFGPRDVKTIGYEQFCDSLFEQFMSMSSGSSRVAFEEYILFYAHFSVDPLERHLATLFYMLYAPPNLVALFLTFLIAC